MKRLVGVFGILALGNAVMAADGPSTFVNCANEQGVNVVSIVHDSVGARGSVNGTAISSMTGRSYNLRPGIMARYEYRFGENVAKSPASDWRGNEHRHHVAGGVVDFAAKFGRTKGAYSILEWDEVCEVGAFGVTWGCQTTAELSRHVGSVTCEITAQ